MQYILKFFLFFLFLIDLLFSKVKKINKKDSILRMRLWNFCVFFRRSTVDTDNVYIAIWTLQNKNMGTNIFATLGQYSCLDYMDRIRLNTNTYYVDI